MLRGTIRATPSFLVPRTKPKASRMLAKHFASEFHLVLDSFLLFLPTRYKTGLQMAPTPGPSQCRMCPISCLFLVLSLSDSDTKGERSLISIKLTHVPARPGTSNNGCRVGPAVYSTPEFIPTASTSPHSGKWLSGSRKSPLTLAMAVWCPHCTGHTERTDACYCLLTPTPMPVCPLPLGFGG